jgi:transposase-like protein DUF772
VLQQDSFPRLEVATGALGADLELLASVVCLAPLARLLSTHRAATGPRAKDRAAVATAFMAKAILNLPTTRDLMSRLRMDEALRRFCGWSSASSLPHESKFSRAFAEFAQTQLPQQLHEAVIAATQQQRLIRHIARDSTPIPRANITRKQLVSGTKPARKGSLNSGRDRSRESKPLGWNAHSAAAPIRS